MHDMQNFIVLISHETRSLDIWKCWFKGNKKDSAPRCRALWKLLRYDAMRAAERSVLISLKSELAICAVELDQGLGGGVLSGQSLVILGDGRSDLLGELLAQFDAH